MCGALAFGSWTYIEKRPLRKSMTQIAATFTWRSHTQPYAITETGRKGMKIIVLSRRICAAGALADEHRTEGRTKTVGRGEMERRDGPPESSCPHYVL